MTWVSVMHWWSVWDLWLTPPFIHSVGEGAALGPADRWGSEKVRDVPEMSQLFRVDGNTLQLCFQYLFLDLATYIGRFFVPLEHCSESFTCINLLNPHYKSVGRIWYNHPHFTSREAETGVRKLPKVMLPARNGAGIYRSPGSGPCSLDGYVTPSFCTLHMQAFGFRKGSVSKCPWLSCCSCICRVVNTGEAGAGPPSSAASIPLLSSPLVILKSSVTVHVVFYHLY